ncbi:MAG: rubrerythrin family protein [Holophagales bacterium]|jgi:rubrerythrin|nr:rubrerythrin family protein [Holophagales bacterium]
MDLSNSKTAQNLLKAFAGESQARNRYAFAAKAARVEGFEHIAAIFEETALNEKEHAKLFYAHLAPLAPGALEIQVAYPIVTGDLKAQLTAAVNGEREEWEKVYPGFAKIAKEEGFDDAARTFDLIARIEREHGERFQRLLDRVGNGTVFTRPEKIRWRCMDCGNIIESVSAPAACPVCKKPQSWQLPVGEMF